MSVKFSFQCMKIYVLYSYIFGIINKYIRKYNVVIIKNIEFSPDATKRINYSITKIICL